MNRWKGPHVVIECQPPRPDVLSKLSATDRHLLERTLQAGRLRWVHHPSFHSPRAMEAAFTIVDAVDAGRKAVGLAGQELQLQAARFLSLNFCRWRAARIVAEHAGCRLPAAAARELIAWQRRAVETRNAIVVSNAPLVPYMLGRRRTSIVDRAEAESAAYLALIRAVDVFDVSRGSRFATLACRLIGQAIGNANLIADRHRRRGGIRIVQGRVAPDEPPPGRGWAPEPDDPEHSPRRLEDAQEHASHLSALRRVIAHNAAELTDRELSIVKTRYKLARPPAEQQDAPAVRPIRERGGLVALEPIGNELGVSKERVRQLERSALGKLRQVLLPQEVPA